MKVRRHIKQLLAVPAYRVKLGFFAILGVALILLAVYVKDEFWRGIILNFSVTFLAVALIQVLWDFLGGDPMEARIERIEGAMRIIADLSDSDIGIERIWPTRKIWAKDPVAGLDYWQDLVCRSREVKIISNTFWNNWLKDDKLVEGFFKSFGEKSAFKLLLYHPNSYVQRLRRQDETKDPKDEMQNEIVSSLKMLAEKRNDIKNPSNKKKLEVRLTHSCVHYVQLIRADNQMLIALYLSGHGGSPSPTMQLRGPRSEYFDTYDKQFEILWNRGEPVAWDNIPDFPDQFPKMPPPKIKDWPWDIKS